MDKRVRQHVELFKIDVKEQVLNDLRTRLAMTRWTDEAEGVGWDYGTCLSFMKELVDYWLDRFDWRAQERRLNQFPQFRAKVMGWNVHFVHVKGRGPKPVPLLISHGWPDTFAGLLKLVPYLSDPAASGGDESDSFDVIIPSLPGFGFSDKRVRRGYVVTAEIFHALMTEVLGYRRFGAQGGDVGAGVTTDLGYLYPDDLMGIHLNNDLRMPTPMPDRSELSEPEREYLRLLDEWEAEEGAYGHIQRTKPQTIAYGLNDSPVGLAAYIIEKFRAWGDTKGDVEKRFSKDELLTTVMIYWVTETINSSMRGYYEASHAPVMPWRRGRIEVPMGAALFANDFVFPHAHPRELAERLYNVRRWKVMPGGGHFAASEEPLALAEEVRAFFKPLRATGK
jgi:pimeloyl-ACP methyl ester carboxylesterase